MATSVLKTNFRRILRSASQLRQMRRYVNRDTDVEGFEFKATSIDILNKEEDALYVHTYSQLGFRLNNGMNVVGPCVLFPRTLLQWDVGGVKDINEKSLSLFYMLEPKLDVLVLGIGDAGARLDPQLIHFMRSKRINLEVLPTDQACATFNFLNSEGRYVAGAFIPPAYMPNEFSDEITMIPGTDPYSTTRDYDYIDDSNPDLEPALLDESDEQADKKWREKVKRDGEKEDQNAKPPKPDM